MSRFLIYRKGNAVCRTLATLPEGFFLAVAIFMGSVFECNAQLPLARVKTLFPMGCQSGASVEVQVEGNDLEGARAIRFSHNGIQAEMLEANTRKFRVTVAGDVPTGVYEAWFVGRYGIANPRAFSVNRLSETNEPGGNDSLEKAAAIEVGTVVNGRSEARKSDFYRIAVKKGQRIIIHCVALGIDSKLEPVLNLRHGDGTLIRKNWGGHLLDWKAKDEGPLLVELHDAVYRGGNEFFYRLEIVSGPHVDFVFPPVIPESNPDNWVTLFGRNLPNGKPGKIRSVDGCLLEELEMKVSDLARLPIAAGGGLSAASAFFKGTALSLKEGMGTSSAAVVQFVDDCPIVMEKEANDSAGQAWEIITPCQFAGRFYPARDVDWLKFSVKKGDVFWLDLHSERLGRDTHPFMQVELVTRDDQGTLKSSQTASTQKHADNPGGRHFDVSTRDVRQRFQAKQDGFCRVMLRDLFNQAVDDPTRVYSLGIRREAPGFRLAALPQAMPPHKKDSREVLQWTTFLRRGETTPIKVIVWREGNYNGPLELSVEGLPPGITFQGGQIPKDGKSATLFLTASEKMESWEGFIRVLGVAKIGSKEIRRSARTGALVHGIGDYNNETPRSRPVAGGLALMVLADEQAPITIRAAGETAIEAPEKGKLRLPLKIQRNGEYNEKLKLKVHGLAAFAKVAELEVDAKKTDPVLEVDLAKFKVPVGNHRLHFETTTKGKYHHPPEKDKKEVKKKDVNFRVYSEPIVFRVTQAEKEPKKKG